MCGGKGGESQNEANKPILSVSLRTPIQAISQVQLPAFFQALFYILGVLFSSLLHQTLFYEFIACKLIDFIITDTRLQVVETVMRTQSIIAAAFCLKWEITVVLSDFLSLQKQSIVNQDHPVWSMGTTYQAALV